MAKITLKAARVNAGLSQIEAAKKINVAPTTLRSWEKGTTSPKVAQMPMICEAYGVAFNDIFFDN